jgi:hypothetical protein
MKVSQNNFIDFKNLLTRADMNNIDIDNDSFSSLSSLSYKNSFPFLPNKINLQSINPIKDNSSFKNDLNYFDYPKLPSSFCDNRIFNISKVKKKGRIKKYRNKSGKHNKYQRDNIIRLFKAHLMNNIYNYINSSFNENQNKPHKKKILQKISSKYIKSISKEDNIKWLNSKLSSVFSQNLSTKIVRYNSNHNEKVINSVFKKGTDINAIFILNHTVKDMWIIYINDDTNHNYIGFSTLKDDIEEFKKLNQPLDYIEKYKKVAIEFEEIINNIKERKRKRKNNK